MPRARGVVVGEYLEEFMGGKKTNPKKQRGRMDSQAFKGHTKSERKKLKKNSM